MPPPDRRLSTYLTTDLHEGAIWDIGREVSKESGRPTLYGRAEVCVGHVHAVGLVAEQDDEPVRHVNVIGWAMLSDPDEEKARIKMTAVELARHSTLFPVTG